MIMSNPTIFEIEQQNEAITKIPRTPPLNIKPSSNIPRNLVIDGKFSVNPNLSGTQSGTKFSINNFEINFLEDQIDVCSQDQGAIMHLEDKTSDCVPTSKKDALDDPAFKQATLDEIEMVKKMKTYHLIPESEVPAGAPIH